MASVKDLFPTSDALKATDLPEGIDVPVVIESARPITFDDGPKLILGFRGKSKVMVCNKTNTFRIADILGDDYD
ncbi:unnamed protein product, partial [marine sediment metagenome]